MPTQAELKTALYNFMIEDGIEKSKRELTKDGGPLHGGAGGVQNKDFRNPLAQHLAERVAAQFPDEATNEEIAKIKAALKARLMEYKDRSILADSLGRSEATKEGRFEGEQPAEQAFVQRVADNARGGEKNAVREALIDMLETEANVKGDIHKEKDKARTKMMLVKDAQEVTDSGYPDSKHVAAMAYAMKGTKTWEDALAKYGEQDQLVKDVAAIEAQLRELQDPNPAKYAAALGKAGVGAEHVAILKATKEGELAVQRLTETHPHGLTVPQLDSLIGQREEAERYAFMRAFGTHLPESYLSKEEREALKEEIAEKKPQNGEEALKAAVAAEERVIAKLNEEYTVLKPKLEQQQEEQQGLAEAWGQKLAAAEKPFIEAHQQAEAERQKVAERHRVLAEGQRKRVAEAQPALIAKAIEEAKSVQEAHKLLTSDEDKLFKKSSPDLQKAYQEHLYPEQQGNPLGDYVASHAGEAEHVKELQRLDNEIRLAEARMQEAGEQCVGFIQKQHLGSDTVLVAEYDEVLQKLPYVAQTAALRKIHADMDTAKVPEQNQQWGELHERSRWVEEKLPFNQEERIAEEAKREEFAREEKAQKEAASREEDIRQKREKDEKIGMENLASLTRQHGGLVSTRLSHEAKVRAATATARGKWRDVSDVAKLFHSVDDRFFTASSIAAQKEDRRFAANLLLRESQRMELAVSMIGQDMVSHREMLSHIERRRQKAIENIRNGAKALAMREAGEMPGSSDSRDFRTWSADVRARAADHMMDYDSEWRELNSDNVVFTSNIRKMEAAYGKMLDVNQGKVNRFRAKLGVIVTGVKALEEYNESTKELAGKDWGSLSEKQQAMAVVKYGRALAVIGDKLPEEDRRGLPADAMVILKQCEVEFAARAQDAAYEAYMKADVSRKADAEKRLMTEKSRYIQELQEYNTALAAHMEESVDLKERRKAEIEQRAQMKWGAGIGALAAAWNKTFDTELGILREEQRQLQTQLIAAAKEMDQTVKPYLEAREAFERAKKKLDQTINKVYERQAAAGVTDEDLESAAKTKVAGQVAEEATPKRVKPAMTRPQELNVAELSELLAERGQGNVPHAPKPEQKKKDVPQKKVPADPRKMAESWGTEERRGDQPRTTVPTGRVVRQGRTSRGGSGVGQV